MIGHVGVPKRLGALGSGDGWARWVLRRLGVSTFRLGWVCVGFRRGLGVSTSGECGGTFLSGIAGWAELGLWVRPPRGGWVLDPNLGRMLDPILVRAVIDPGVVGVFGIGGRAG